MTRRPRKECHTQAIPIVTTPDSVGYSISGQAQAYYYNYAMCKKVVEVMGAGQLNAAQAS